MTRNRVLVTGAGGRLGAVVTRRLADRGDLDVIPVVSPRSRTRLPSAVVLDLADHHATARLVEDVRPDAVIHLASINGADCDLDPIATLAVNVEATRALAHAAEAAGSQRFVFTSSAAVYGTEYRRPIKEEDPLLGGSLYGRSKIEAEAALAQSAGDMRTIALRVFNLYGPAFDNSLITRLRNSHSKEPVVLVGLDGFVRDYVHVDDVAQAIEGSLDADLPRGASTFNVGSGVILSNRDVVELLERNGPIHFLVNGQQVSWSGADISKARRILGFSPHRAVGETDAGL